MKTWWSHLLIKGTLSEYRLLPMAYSIVVVKVRWAMTALDEGDDMVLDVFVAKTHDMLLFFTNLGRVYSLQVFEVPEASRMANGRAIVNLLPLQEGEHVVKLLRARDLDGKSLVMISKNGVIKRTEASQFANIRATGIRACYAP